MLLDWRMEEQEDDPITQRIIGCGIEVHRQLGRGLLEKPYHVAMCIELDFNGIAFERERPIDIEYRGHKIGHYFPDLIVSNEVVVEIKSVYTYDPASTAQMLTYLRVTKLRKGLILNFNRELLKQGIKRIVL
jgi:GxxExxY protein